MKNFVSVIIIVIVLAGCRTSRQIQQSRGIQHDTVYLSNIQYDSIYVFQDHLTDRSRDTVYVKDVQHEYRYKLLRDTVRIVQRDSIPYEVTIVKSKETVRPLTWFDHLTRLTFWLLLGAVLTWLYLKIIKSVVRVSVSVNYPQTTPSGSLRLL